VIDPGKVRAVVTTRWGKGNYRPLVIHSVESYYVDTSIDNDADLWSIQIGDPENEYGDVFKRDAEVRVQVFGVSPSKKSDFIVTGIADEIEVTEDGLISLSGRDMSAVAIDSDVPPKQYKLVRAWAIVERQARELGIGNRLSLARKGIIKKTQYTDGSESYWEFWHRLYRKEKMWIWTEPNGTIVADTLNYEDKPSYFLGTPRGDESAAVKQRYIEVFNVQLRKTTQGRLGEVWIYGNRGDRGFLVIENDPTTRLWQKRPRKIMLDSEASSPKIATKRAWEEIFEGKVGSLELTVTVSDPGHWIRQNRVAKVRIPERGIFGEFFVVGTRMVGGADGFMQEVRLREKQFAISRRTPSDPKLIASAAGFNAPGAGTGLSTSLEQEIRGSNIPYAEAFIAAAREFHGPWNFSLFLAVLLGIAEQETGFRNVRSNGGPGESGVEWYKWDRDPSFGIDEKKPERPRPVNTDRFGRTLQQWEEIFANEPGSAYTNQTWAVGVMQLYSLSYKHKADDYFKQGYHDQYRGGRWHIPSNIRAAAFALREKLKQAVRDSGRDIDIWAGVAGYGHHYPGEPAFDPNNRYAREVKNKVQNDPGYLGTVQDSLEAAREAAKARREGDTDGTVVSPSASETDSGDPSLPTFTQTLATLTATPPQFVFQNEITKRDRVVAAAMFGYYSRDQISYDQTRNLPDFAPPPNVPSVLDCSSFATWCYKSAGLPDPSGQNYSPIGWTGTLYPKGAPVNPLTAKPGDLIFYGTSGSIPNHVAVAVGNKKVVSHGQESGPVLVPYNYRADVLGARTYI
jgi:prophage tail gpP-like protein/cell wall-associated NlpC family hydrolase